MERFIATPLISAGSFAELPERFGHEIHAFTLMDNHYHLLLRTAESKRFGEALAKEPERRACVLKLKRQLSII